MGKGYDTEGQGQTYTIGAKREGQTINKREGGMHRSYNRTVWENLNVMMEDAFTSKTLKYLIV